MPSDNPWMSAVVQNLKKNPFVFNTFLVLFLVALETFVEVDFVCPCDLPWNTATVSLHFIVPTVVTFVLSLSIQRKLAWEAFFSSSFLAITWTILLFLDGRYFACAKTDWPGTYELFNNASHHRWCNNSTLGLEAMQKTQKWYSESQIIGLGMTLFFAACYGVFVCCEICCKSSRRKTWRRCLEKCCHCCLNFINRCDEKKSLKERVTEMKIESVTTDQEIAQVLNRITGVQTQADPELDPVRNRITGAQIKLVATVPEIKNILNRNSTSETNNDTNDREFVILLSLSSTPSTVGGEAVQKTDGPRSNPDSSSLSDGYTTPNESPSGSSWPAGAAASGGEVGKRRCPFPRPLSPALQGGFRGCYEGRQRTQMQGTERPTFQRKYMNFYNSENEGGGKT